MTGPYDEIVSLGNHGRVAYNLRRTFGIQRAFPFDWWITPVQSLAAFLEDPSIDKLYDPARMAPVVRDGRIWAIENVHYGIQLQHEFPRLKNGSVVEDWPGRLGQARQRTEFLWDRLLGAPAGARILFVRWFADAERKALKRNGRPVVDRIEASLKRLFPRTGFELLLVDPPEWIERPGASSLHVGDHGGGWKGRPDLWSERLLAAGLAWTGSPSKTAPAGPEQDHLSFA